MKTAYLALGGSIGDVERTLSAACGQISARIGLIKASSRAYRTMPLLTSGSADPNREKFLNMAVAVETSLEPREILKQSLAIEAAMGRVRSEETRWGPRTLDIDLLLVDDLILDEPGLALPHPEMHRRDFVLRPLAEIARDSVHPVILKTIGSLLSDWEESGLTRTILD